MDKQTPATIAPIGITMGCPAGIGPEIILKYHLDPAVDLAVPPVVIGDPAVLTTTAAALGLSATIRPWYPGTRPAPKSLNLLAASALDPASLVVGKPTVETGRAMAGYIDAAVALCQDGSLGGITTGPISKAALNKAGYHFPGHTEMLAQRTGAPRVAMMLAGSRLRVVPLTIHCALAEVPRALHHDAIVDLVALTDQALRTDFNLAAPRIGVAGLNPHGGEGGLFGKEEQAIIGPAIKQCARSGIDVSGPLPPDTVFYQAAAGRYDVVVCMYHDQGLIPFKLLHFEDGVNITLGLPIVRTSVDHGTAYDIAGRGLADHRSLKNAVAMAALIGANRAAHSGKSTAPPTARLS